MREHVSGMNPRAGTLHHEVFCVYAGRGRTFRPRRRAKGTRAPPNLRISLRHGRPLRAGSSAADHRFRLQALNRRRMRFSSRATAAYIRAASRQSTTTEAMTRSSRNTCPPYTIR